jgi:hypothetical protein
MSEMNFVANDLTYLKLPPPFASMHFRVHSGVHGRGRVSFLWGVSKKWRKFRVAVECANTLDDITVVELIFLSSNCDLLPDKLREPTWELFINYLVKLV